MSVRNPAEESMSEPEPEPVFTHLRVVIGTKHSSAVWIGPRWPMQDGEDAWHHSNVIRQSIEGCQFVSFQCEGGSAVILPISDILFLDVQAM